MRNAAKDVVVIGAGIIGTMSSYLLSKRGLSVAIVDADAPGSHASGLAFGGLDPLHGMGLPEPLLDFSLHCFTRHQDVARELHGATGIDHHFQTRNRLYLAFDEGDIREYDANLSWMKDISMFDVGWVDGDTARRLEPKVNPACIGAMYQQGAASVDAYSLTLAAARAAEQQGTELVAQRATGFKSRGSRVDAVTFADGQVNAGAVIIAMGPWSQLIADWCDTELPVQPLKGQILRLRYDGPAFDVALNYRGNYIDTKPDGLVWTGSTEEEEGFDATPSATARDVIWQNAVQMAPDLGKAELVRQTACLRPVTPDGMPIVDRLPGWDNLYVATGAGRKGILWSTGMCDIIANMVMQGDLEVAGAEHLKVDRFARV